MPSHRAERLSGDIRRELSALIKELRDPRINDFLAVTRVEATGDLSYAKVYISSIDGSAAAAEACAVLKKAGSHLRAGLSKNMHIRKAPELQFYPDDSSEYYEKISHIIERVNGDE